MFALISFKHVLCAVSFSIALLLGFSEASHVTPQADEKNKAASVKSDNQLQVILPEFEAYIQKAQAQWGAPGAAVAIVKDGKMVFAKGFGVRVAQKDLPVNEHTVFQVASLSKNMLAHLIARLAEEKKLSFDDLVVKHLPDFKLHAANKRQTITIRDLLSHRIGLPGFTADTLWYLNFSVHEMMEGIAKIPLITEPRSKYNYQNQIFGLASLIAEKVTGKKIEELYKEYFFTPMGMQSASCSLEAIAPQGTLAKLMTIFDNKNVASPHDIRSQQASPLPFSHLTYVFPGSTGVNISVVDYAKWMIMMLGKGQYEGVRLLQESSFNELTRPLIDCHMSETDLMFPHNRYKNVQYGMGFYRLQYGDQGKSVEAYLHMGAFYGVRALMMIVPSENLGIVVFSNLGSNRVSLLPETLINRFMDLYMGLPDVDWSEHTFGEFKKIKISNKRYKEMERAHNPSSCLPLENYTGTFKNDLYGTVKVTVENGRLVFHYRDRHVELEHFNSHQFSFQGNMISPAYCETDVGYVYFGGQKPGIVHLMQIPSLLREGVDEGMFEKQD